MNLKVDKNKIIYKKIKNLESTCTYNVMNFINDEWICYDWPALKNSIKKHGIKTPLVLTRHGDVVDGHHRLTIAKLIYNPEDKVPCVYDDEVDFWPNYDKFFKSEYRRT